MPPDSSAEDQIAQPTGTQPTAKSADENSAGSSPAGSPDANTAESSPAEDAKKPTSMLDAVKAAIARDGAEKSSTSENGISEQQTSKDSDAAEDSAEDEHPGDLTAEERAKLSERTYKRLKYFTRRANRLEKDVTRLTLELDRVRPSAESFEKLSTYVRDAGLSRDEVDDLIKVGALAKTNPWAARERVVEFLKQLDQVTGHVLPDDLKQQVQQGYISEPHALELSQHRARQHRGDVQSQHQQQARQAEQARQTEQRLVNDVATAVSAWENKWKSEDPDYRALHARVSEKMELALVRAQQAGKLPKTTAEATALADKVLAEARQEMKPLLTKREPIRPVAGSHASPTARPKPTNMLEAIRQAVGR